MSSKKTDDKNKNSENSHINNNNNIINNINSKKVENIEILLRLYCFQEEIKGKINNYDKYKMDYFGIIADKDFIEEYKKLLDYKTFINKFIDDKKNKQLFKFLKDENGIINHDKLDEKNQLLIIINEFKKAHPQSFEKINNIKLNKQNFKTESFQIKCKKMGDTELSLLDEFELINIKIFELIKKQFSFDFNSDFCKFFLGKDYTYFHIYLTNIEDTKIISEIGKYENKSNSFKMEYIINCNNLKDNLGNEFFTHIKQIGPDAVINTFKSQKGKENTYLLGADKKIIYYKIEKNKIKQINNKNGEKIIKKKEVYTNDIKFQKNEVLQKLIYLYCYYLDIYKQIYSNNNNMFPEKVYLINSKKFSEIKIDLDYKILKDDLDNNEQIQKIIQKNPLQLINIDDIIKLLPPNHIEKYKKKKIKIKSDVELAPDLVTNGIPNYNDSIMVFDEFEIIDKLILNYFFENTNIIKNINGIETSCIYKDGKVIINIPKYLNDNKYFITLVGFLEDETFIFLTTHIFVYNNECDQNKHVNNIIDNDIYLYLDTIKEEFTPIIYEGKNIGIVIKNKIEEPKKESIKIGLQNIGATCYMNATLQCFAHIKEFVNYFKNNNKKLDVIKDKNTLSYSFKILIDKLWPEHFNKKSKTYYAPYEFKEKISNMNPLFQGIAANDSKDLINFIVMTLHEELNIANPNINLSNQMPDQSNKEIMFKEFMTDFKQRYNSLASDLFYGANYNRTQCTQCGIQLYNYQVYFFLIFPLEEVRKFVYQNNNNNQFNQFNFDSNQINQINNIQTNNNVVDIYQCFEFDKRICLMSGDNSMYCNSCQISTPCNICTNLVYGPNILIIILNRGQGKQFDVKLNFYEDLNLNNYIEIKQTGVNYKLIGVITHLGESGMSGHFIAFCKDPDEKKWYKFNDAIVSPVENFKSEVIDYAMPYLLFYQKEYDI